MKKSMCANINKLGSEILTYPVGAILIILIISFIIYYPVFSHQLMTGWDDEWQVVNYLTESGFTWNNIFRLFAESYHNQYSPINHCMYIAIYAIDGYEPFYYHLASWLIHMANAILVYVLLRYLLFNTTQLLPKSIDWIAFLTTLMFAIHPLQVESVAWISASKILTYTFFTLLATWFFIRLLQNEKHYVLNYLLTLFFFLCAYGCKEQAVIFPVWATLLCLYFGYNLKAKRMLRILFPFYVVSLILGIWFIYGISSYANVSSISDVSFSWWQRLIFSCYAFSEYIIKWFMPYQLSHIYYYPMVKGEALPQWLLLYPMLLLLIGWGLFKWLRHKMILAGGVFFLINILFVLHVIPVNRPWIMADRYIYLGAVGLSFIASYFLVEYYSKWKISIQRLNVIFVFIVFMGLGVYSYQRVLLWYDTETLKLEIKELLDNVEEKREEMTAVKYIINLKN